MMLFLQEWDSVMADTAPDQIPSCLTQADLARAARFVRAEDRGRFLAARLGLQRILAEHAGIRASPLELGFGPNGKPELAGSGLQFNWSHSGAYVAWIIGDRLCGVDIEQHDKNLAMDRSSICSEREWSWLERSVDPDAAFMDLWTAKESVVKALGRGLSLDPREVSINMQPSGPMTFDSLGDWTCRLEVSIAGRTKRVTSGASTYSLSWCHVANGHDALPSMWSDAR